MIFLGHRGRSLRGEQGRERRERQVHMVLGDQGAVVVRVGLDVALVIKDDQLDRAAEQAAVAVHVAGPQFVALLAGQPVRLEPSCLLRPGQRQRDADGDRLAGGAGQQVIRVAGTAQTARGNGSARGGHRHEPESLGAGAPHQPSSPSLPVQRGSRMTVVSPCPSQAVG